MCTTKQKKKQLSKWYPQSVFFWMFQHESQVPHTPKSALPSALPSAPPSLLSKCPQFYQKCPFSQSALSLKVPSIPSFFHPILFPSLFFHPIFFHPIFYTSGRIALKKHRWQEHVSPSFTAMVQLKHLHPSFGGVSHWCSKDTIMEACLAPLEISSTSFFSRSGQLFEETVISKWSFLSGQKTWT